LSIACEIVALPPVLIFEDPMLTLEPGVGHAIMASIATLASRGHTVLCAMDSHSLTAPLLPMVSQIIVVAEGYSLFASNADNIEPYFCSGEMGYRKRSDVHIIDFVMDIAHGVERSTTSRIAESVAVLHEKFAASAFNTTNARTLSMKSENLPLRGLPQSNFFDAKYNYFVSLMDASKLSSNLSLAWCTLTLWLYRVYLVIERQVWVKFSDFQLLLRGVFASIIVGSVVGYLQYNCGDYGYYSMTFVGFPYVGTANTTAVIFFISAFTLAQQALNVHLMCQSLQMFRYEQFSGVCPTMGHILGFVLTEFPVVAVNIIIFGSIIFFMTSMSYGLDNYLFFVEALALNALIGTSYTKTVVSLILPTLPNCMFVTRGTW
jgi:hypothetical protein